MAPSRSNNLPEWVEKLPLSQKNKKTVVRILDDTSADIQKQVEDLLTIGDQLEVFLEGFRSVIEQGEHVLDDYVEITRSFPDKPPEEDLLAVLAAINGGKSTQLRQEVLHLEKLKRVVDRIRARKDAGISVGNAVRMSAQMDDKERELLENSCEDRGPAVFKIVERRFDIVKAEWPPLTPENIQDFLKSFTGRALKSVRAFRKRGGPNRIRKEIREDPALPAYVSAMCNLIVVRDVTLRKVVRFSPAMLGALLRQVPPETDMQEIQQDYKLLRRLPQHSRTAVMAGTLRRSFYFDGATEAERETEIDPDVKNACDPGVTPTPVRVVRAEFATDQDVFVLRDALHPHDTLIATVAAPHPLAGRKVTLHSTMGRTFEVTDIEGGAESDEKDSLEKAINVHPLKVLEAGFSVDWAES